MSQPCDVVAERVALGEPLGDLADHAASCARCRRLAALPAELGAVRVDADPGLGFAARMTAGAQHRIVVRRRRRIAGAAVAAVAATTLGVFLFTRAPEPAGPVAQPAADPKTPSPDPWSDDARPSDDGDDDARALLELANTDRSRHFSAHWNRIEKPLAPYRALVKGVEP